MLKRGTDRSHEINCKQVNTLLGAYLEGGLPAEQADAVEAHLDTCLDCRRAASLDAEVASRLRMEAAWQRRCLSPRAAARIQQRLYGRMRRSMMAQRVSRFAWGAVGLALLALVLFGGYAWWQQRPVALNAPPTARASRTPSPRIVGLEATAEATVPHATPSLPPVPTTTPTRRVHEAQPGSLSTRDPSLPIPNEPTGTRTPGPTATARSSPTPVPTQRQPEILARGILDCAPLDGYSRCVDDILGIEFEYPESWGKIEARLRTGGFAGLAYDYYFDGKPLGETEPIGAGGRSVDFAEGRGAMPTDFGGYDHPGSQRTSACGGPGEWFSNSYPVCRQVSDHVAWMIRFPSADVLCAEGLGNWTTTSVFRIEVYLPDNATINGFVFEAPFLSSELAMQVDQDLYPLLGVRIDERASKCDEASRQAFDAQRTALIERIIERSADAETLESVDELIYVAESIAVRER